MPSEARAPRPCSPGRLPSADDEISLGRVTAHDVGAGVGDDAHAHRPDRHADVPGDRDRGRRRSRGERGHRRGRRGHPRRVGGPGRATPRSSRRWCSSSGGRQRLRPRDREVRRVRRRRTDGPPGPVRTRRHLEHRPGPDDPVRGGGGAGLAGRADGGSRACSRRCGPADATSPSSVHSEPIEASCRGWCTGRQRRSRSCPR